MRYTYDKERESLKLELTEEIDMNSCKALRSIIDGYIIKYNPKECILDLNKVNFMDSSGLGLIMGRHSLIKMLNAKLTLVGPNESIKKIIKLSHIGKEIRIV